MFPNESDEAIPNDFCGWCTLIMTDDLAENILVIFKVRIEIKF